MLVPLILAFVLSLVYFFSESYFHHLRRVDIKIISFSSGLFISFIFLGMFPEVIKGFSLIQDNILLIALWGFIIFHIAEKHVFQHVTGMKNKLKQIDRVRTVGFFTNHFILGFALIFFFRDRGDLGGLFLSIPILFHMISSALLSDAIHRKIHESIFHKVFASSAIFLGALLGTFLTISTVFYSALFAFATGMFLYLIIRDVMPKEARGNVSLFLLGIIMYFVIVLFERVILFGL